MFSFRGEPKRRDYDWNKMMSFLSLLNEVGLLDFFFRVFRFCGTTSGQLVEIFWIGLIVIL